MEFLALLLLFPLVWPFVAKAIFKHELTVGEVALNIVVVALAVCALWFGGRYMEMADKEILNGQVVDKTSQRVSCEHSYTCNCRESCSGSGSNRSCSTTCDTCYEHAYDVDWNLKTSVGAIEVDRIDRRGTKEPPRWTRAKQGDPVAMPHSHANYIKGAPDSLFNAISEKTALLKYGAQVPAYPLAVYDLHYLDRVLVDGVALPDLASWNNDLADLLRYLGPSKEVNLVVVFTKNPDPAYADAVRVKWLGGKKNDVVVVLGTPEYPKLEWARVLSWTDRELFKVQLRDELLELTELSRETVLGAIARHTTATFKRRPMEDFSYLLNEIHPPTWMLILIGVLGAAASVGLSFFLSRNSVRALSARQLYSSFRAFR